MKTIFLTADGGKFLSEEEAKNHEMQLQLKNEFNGKTFDEKEEFLKTFNFLKRSELNRFFFGDVAVSMFKLKNEESLENFKKYCFYEDIKVDNSCLKIGETLYLLVMEICDNYINPIYSITTIDDLLESKQISINDIEEEIRKIKEINEKYENNL